ncbi:MAG TPA: ATP-binding protein [Vicinamibacteria bacterium]|nr:ATP-binding protein [Vicinamibacteria bacterium]
MIPRGGFSAAARVAILHEKPQRAEFLARVLAGAGHRVTTVAEGFGAVTNLVAADPELVVASCFFADPPLRTILSEARACWPDDIPTLMVVGREDAGGSLETDEIIREPVDPKELAFRVSTLLRSRAERSQLQRKLTEIAGIYRVFWPFSLASGAEGLYGQIAHQAAELTRAAKALVLLYDPDRREMLAQPPGHGFSREQAQVHYPVDGEARSLWNFRTNGPLLSNQAAADSRLLAGVLSVLDLNSLLVVPVTRGPQVLGLLLVADRAPNSPFGEADLALLQAFAGQAGVAIENQRLHENLQHANAMLKEYDRLKSEFVAMVAHDFRKPLTAIRGFAELVLESPSLAQETREEFMRTVIRETDALASLAEDTLLISRIETGELSFEFAELDLGGLLLECMPLGLSEHSILVDTPPEQIRIRADPFRLRQVVNNLISNAVKYSPRGGTVTVRTRLRGPDHVSLEVMDQGLGIPKEELRRLFQKFQRVRTPGHLAIPGTGLGLYICRLIVQGHGGRVWVESEPGQGSTFGVLLPRRAREAA